MDVLSWRPLQEPDRSAVTGLAGACLAADGGQPYAADPGFLGGWYFAAAATWSGWDDGRLVCASALRLPGGEATGQAATAVTSGLVHPDWRRRGLGGHAFAWAAARASRRPFGADTEMLSDGAHGLYLSRGLTQVFAEDVMQLPASAPVPAGHQVAGLSMENWGPASPGRFHAVYEAAFRERPGFPGWTAERWASWICDDVAFRPEWTLLVTLAGTDAAFVAAESGGWITQTGVVPQARGRGIGAAVLTEVIRRMRAAGETVVTLNVNVNNPHAAALYRRLGFTRTGGRARYRQSSMT